MDLADVKERCSTLERCLPVGGYRVIIAKLHNEMIDEISRLQGGEGGGHCEDCCCARSWTALGINEYTGKSIPEHITALRSQLSIVEGTRDTLYNLVGVEMDLKKKAESERDTWLSAHDAVYVDLQGVKGELAEATRLQKKSEMLLESSERCRAGLGEELQRVKGERDRYWEAVAWVAIEEKLPEADVPVLAYFINEYGKTRRIRAFYAPRFTVTTGVDNDWYEFKDGDDEAYLPEGWYESNEFEDTHWHVTDKVTHWMPLPELPSTSPPNIGEGEQVCEWVAGDKRGCYVTKCGDYLYGPEYKFCPHCGKPIKVKE